MKVKQLGRLCGAIDALVWTMASSKIYDTFSNADYNLFLQDSPIEAKLIGAVYLGSFIPFIPICALGFADGIVDVIKGTHHYFGLKVWQKITRKQETKKQIQSELEKSLIAIDKSL